MLRLYGSRASERIIRRCGSTIRRLEERYPLPAPVLQAILYQELTQIDVFDILADCLVQLNWLRLSLLGRLDAPLPARRGLLTKLDSSTGYAQIFAFVAIDAANFALDRSLATPEALGFPPGQRPDKARGRDLLRMWQRLQRDRDCNLEFAALNLLSAAEERTGRIDFSSYTPEELKLIFTRYNGKNRAISPYGEAVYRHYLRYRATE